MMTIANVCTLLVADSVLKFLVVHQYRGRLTLRFVLETRKGLGTMNTIIRHNKQTLKDEKVKKNEK